MSLNPEVDALLQSYVSDLTSLIIDQITKNLRFLPENERSKELLEALKEAVTGGKRLRAQMAFAGTLICDYPDRGRALRLGAALELYQASALIHDDIIDNADTRRGRPSAHRSLREPLAGALSLENADHYGRSAALLLGDLALSTADRIAWELSPHLDFGELWTRMTASVAYGQYLDLYAETGVEQITPVKATEIATYKAARYSVVDPLLLGVSLAGGGYELRHSLNAAFEPIGVAFQFRDDLLGVFGEEETIGKPAGADLAAGKRTILIAEALERGNSKEQDFINSHLGQANLAVSELAVLRDILIRSGARQAVENRIELLYQRGMKELEFAHLNDFSRGLLTHLANILVSRDS
ncbi:MAG: polyprenyl synthetase family protein [Varibaculum sp.]|nr:polyprenyl synthetase family protein [Varibaculum sp.]